jgi:hypothetical protein
MESLMTLAANTVVVAAAFGELATAVEHLPSTGRRGKKNFEEKPSKA